MRTICKTVFSLIFLVLTGVPAFAADGSGTMGVTPDSAIAGKSGQDFTFTYTASEDMGDGSVNLLVPDPWPDPTALNTTVTVTDGLTGTLINNLDGASATGWSSDFIGPLSPLCGLLNVVCDLDLSTDTSDKHAGSGSLHADFGLANIAVAGNARIMHTYASAQDWSAYTRLSFWVKTDGLALANLLGGASLEISESTGLNSSVSYPLSGALLDVTLLNAGQWTQVIIDLTGHTTGTRNAVRSYGLTFPNLLSVSLTGDLHIDQVMAGPAGPVFSGNNVRQDLISLDQGGTVEFDYHGVTVPNQTGDYTFTTTQQIDSSGPLTALVSGSPVIEVLSNVETACDDNLDNDANGLFDCDDPDCAGDAACDDSVPVPEHETICDDQTDNDGDDAIDCSDSDCAETPACAELDEDGDGVDNGDDNCVTVANPNQADRDGDGIGDACDDTIDKDVDSDGGKEQAKDENGDGCYGDLYTDPDGSSDDCFATDGNHDGCDDFFIDVDGDSCDNVCPDLYWNPTGDILVAIHDTTLDIDGDGDAERVCAYDSDGDGSDDSYTVPDASDPNNPPAVSGQGAGQKNPFLFTGGGCSLGGNPTNWTALLGLLNSLLGIGVLRVRRK